MAFNGFRNNDTSYGGRIELVINDVVVGTIWGDAYPLYIQSDEGILKIRRTTDDGVFLSMWEQI